MAEEWKHIEFIESVSVSAPAVRTVVLQAELGDGEAIHHRILPVLLLKACVVVRASIRKDDFWEWPATYREARQRRWEFAPPETRIEPVVCGLECDLEQKAVVEEKYCTSKVVACVWRAEQDEEKFSPLFAEMDGLLRARENSPLWK